MNDLSSLVPPKALYERYIERELPGTNKKDLAVLEAAVRNGWNAILMGPTGPGKTSAYLALCAKNEWPLGIVSCNGMTTVEDIVGQVVPVSRVPDVDHLIDQIVDYKTQSQLAKAENDAKAFVESTRAFTRAELQLNLVYQSMGIALEWVDGILVRLMKGDPNFEHTVLLADEINFAPAKVMAVINSVTDDRRSYTIVQHEGEVVKAHPGFHFAAAMNPGYEGTRQLNRAFKDRFTVKLHYDYDDAIEAKLVKNERLRGLAKRLRDMVAKEEVTTPISTRMLMQFEAIEAVLGLPMAVEIFCAAFEEDERVAVRQATEMVLRGGRGTTGRTKPAGDADV